MICDSPVLQSTSAVDIDPKLHGLRLAEIVNGADAENSPRVVAQLSDAASPSCAVAVHCTGSSVRSVLPELLELIDAGLNVVSTCEELSFPWRSAPREARALHSRAVKRRVTVLGTGVNPGFAMDYLPIVLSGVLSRVDHVHVLRIQDIAERRLSLQEKVGLGASRASFDERVRNGGLGHVGLRQSADALAAAFNWTFDNFTERIEPVLARSPQQSHLGKLSPGQALGLRQVASAEVAGKEVVLLDLTLAVAARNPRDEVRLSGDTVVHVAFPDGLQGDSATAALVMNSIPRVVRAAPGLVTMADLPPAHSVA
jgi:4-hydroxy-tetrahydrodipicolinate reductase